MSLNGQNGDMKETGSLFFTVTEEAFFSGPENRNSNDAKHAGFFEIDREFERRNEIFGIGTKGANTYIYCFCKKKYHVARMASQYAFETE